MDRFKIICAIGVLFVVIASGCNSGKKDAPASQAQDESAPSGKVVETMNSGGYTYLSLEKNGKKIWVAVPAASVKVGQEVTCQPGMVMNNFKSKTLNRTFDSVIFSGGIR